jgi:Na+/phosphate symporter
MTIYLAPLVMVIGALVWFFAGNAKVAEMGRIMFAFGLLVTLSSLGGKSLHF